MSKPEYDKALYRLTTIICRLNVGEALSVKELAAEFGVSVRTIQKDLNERLSHLPIERREADGRYHFIGNYRMRGTGDPDAILVADLMAAMIRNVNSEYTRIADNFLKGRSFSTSCFLFHLNLEDISGCGDLFRLLNQAVALRQQISFDYRNLEGEAKHYTAHPYRLANLRGYWYLLAYDLGASRLKSFYLKNISTPVIHPGSYRVDRRVMAELENFNGAIFSPWVRESCRSVRLKVVGKARIYLERNPPAAVEIGACDGESLLVEMTYFAETEVLSLVKQWLPDIEILDQPELSARLREELKEYCRKVFPGD